MWERKKQISRCIKLRTRISIIITMLSFSNKGAQGAFPESLDPVQVIRRAVD